MKSIKLAFLPHAVGGVTGNQRLYQVISIKNSVDFNPGENVIESEVKALCTNPRWDVTVVGHSGDR